MLDGKCSQCRLTNSMRICRHPDGSAPSFCPSELYAGALRKAEEIYRAEAGVVKFAAEASRQESACYQHIEGRLGVHVPTKPRIVETIEFCKRMNYTRIGFAFCGGLHREAQIVGGILESHGFSLVSVMCKVGCIDKSRIGLSWEEKINGTADGDAHESMCNPIGQAQILNEAKTEFNIAMGLCVGHDSLFLKYSDALCTVLAVKDRVLGHNPLAAVYTSESYYRSIVP